MASARSGLLHLASFASFSACRSAGLFFASMSALGGAAVARLGGDVAVDGVRPLAALLRARLLGQTARVFEAHTKKSDYIDISTPAR